jgi:hypothetical protein
MTLVFDAAGTEPKADAQGQILFQEPVGTFRLAIDNYPSDKMEDWISSVQWQADGAALQAFEENSGQEWSINLGQNWTWVRGVHKLRAVVRTNELEPKEYTTELTLRYQPKPPQITLQTPPSDQTVDKPAFTLRAELTSGLADQPAQISLVHRDAKQEVVKERQYELKGSEKLSLDEPLKLEPGQNEIIIVAKNQGALQGQESWETSRRVLFLTYLKPREDPPPRISAQIFPLLDDSKTGQAIETQAGQPVIVHEPSIRIAGVIKAAANSGNLERAEWSRGDGPPEKLANFTPGKHEEWPIGTDFTLKPGANNKVRFLAKTTHSPLKEFTATIDYRPPLPEVVLTAPADGTFLYDGKDGQEVSLEARVAWPKDRQPAAWELLLNDSRDGEAHTLDTQSQLLTAKVRLRPGRNTLQVRLHNAWTMSRLSEPVHVNYLQPPRILEFQGPTQTEKPLVDLEARISSHSKLGVSEVDVNGTRKVVSSVVDLIREGTWRLRLKDVPLDNSGDNIVRLTVRNEDTKSLEPATWTLRYAPPPKLPAAPEVEILDPLSGRKMSEPEAKVVFLIKSAARPRQVELARAGDGILPVRIPLDPSKLEPEQQGFFRGEASIRLTPGLNNLYLTAGNEGGQQTTAPVAVSYSRVPVSLVIDQLEPWGQTGDAIKPASLTSGEYLVPKEVAIGRLWLYGRILANKPDDEQLRKVKGVWVYINGIRQLPAELRPLIRNSKERAFRVPLLLNEAENQISIELSNLLQDAGNRSQFTLACKSPEKKQRLHLIIVGVGATDVKQLRERALKAVQAEAASETTFRTPAFAEGYIEGPRTTYVTRHHMNSLLANVRDRIKQLAKKGPAMSDVIMFYYQGRETVDTAGDLHWSDLSWRDMQNIFAEMPGAHLLLLDVTREKEGKDRAGRWSDDSRVGVLRYAWLGPQAPNEARLITALEESMPRAVFMRDVQTFLGNKYDQISQNFASEIAYDGYLPADIKNLAIGRVP